MPIAIPLPPDDTVTNTGLQTHPLKSINQLSPRISHDPLPVDVIRRISSHLINDGHFSTVATLHRCSKELYFALTPILYHTFHIKLVKSDNLLRLGTSSVPYGDSTGDKLDTQSVNDLFAAYNTQLRRLASFKHIRHLIIHSLPSDEISEIFAQSVEPLPSPIFPNIGSVQLLPQTVDDLRTWVPISYDRPRNPVFLETLVSNSSPSKLCISFTSVLSENWEEHRDLTISGQYQLISRITKLHSDGWKSSLTEFNVHNIGHQIIPSLPHCTNNYYFNSHITGTLSKPVLHPPGLKSNYLPGPEWSYRSWQLGKCIKNLFPSGIKNVNEIVNDTRWNFINVKGHILTKMFRDDDDDSGVGYNEVFDLIENSLKVGLPKDLPLREGFDKDLVDKVFDRIKYIEDEECDTCHQSAQSIPKISTIRDIS